MDRKNKQDLLLPLIKKYGSHCMAYSTLQDGLQYDVYGDEGFIAYLSFKHLFWCRSGVKIVLADPICAPEDYHRLLAAFLAKHEHVIFIQFSEAVAQVLHDLGYEVNQFGIETELLLHDFSLVGKHRAKLRQWRNKCEREGVTVQETDFASPATDMDAIKALSQQWMKRKGGHELVLLTRPMVYRQEPDVRAFTARKNGDLMGIAVFDPIYKQQQVVGYYHNIDRISPQAVSGVSAYLLLQALEQFKAEGKSLVSLGMSPLYNIRRTSFRLNDFFHDALWFAYRNLEFLYPFQGNAVHKKKFHGDNKAIYFSSTRGNNLWQLFTLLKALKLF